MKPLPLDALTAASMKSPEGGYLYFCYGSNMSREKLRTRGAAGSGPIEYDSVEVGRLRDHRLCFDLRGAPPAEPCMGSIERAAGDEVYGLLYRLRTASSWGALLASEGVSNAPESDGYWVTDVRVEVAPASGGAPRTLAARTLMTNPGARVPRAQRGAVRPSQRYMRLLIGGAAREGLPAAYVARLRRVRTARAWAPGLLPAVMMFVVPLLFAARRLRAQRLVAPLSAAGGCLYAAHERLAETPRPGRAHAARVAGVRLALLLLYAAYALPTGVLLLLSPRTRMMARRMRGLVKGAPEGGGKKEGGGEKEGEGGAERAAERAAERVAERVAERAAEAEGER